MDKAKRFFKRVLFVLSVARTAEWLMGGGGGVLLGGIVGVIASMSGVQLAFAAVAALGAFVVCGVAVVARIAWRRPKICVEAPQLSDISITASDAPFRGGLLATQALSATSSITTVSGVTVSQPAEMLLVPVSNEYAPSRDVARNLTVYLSCWTEDGEEVTREVRAHQRGAPVGELPLELAATGAPVLFDSICKVVEADNASIYTDAGATDDLRVDEQAFVLQIAVRGEFPEIRAGYLVTHSGARTRLLATRL
jgi:hypothetical protein